MRRKTKWEEKQKLIAPSRLVPAIFPRFGQVTGNGRNSDWFMAMFAPVMIGQSSNYSGIGFSTVIWKPL